MSDNGTAIAPLWTMKDVIRALAISKSKAYELADKGVIPPVRIPGCTKKLFDPEDIRRLIQDWKKKE